MPMVNSTQPTTPSVADSLTITALPASRPHDPERNQHTTDYQTIQNLNGNKSPLVSENGEIDVILTKEISTKLLMNGALPKLLMPTLMPMVNSTQPTTPSVADSLTISALPASRPHDPERNQ